MQQRLLDQSLRDLVDVPPRSFGVAFPAEQPAPSRAADRAKALSHRRFRTVIERASMRWRLKGDRD